MTADARSNPLLDLLARGDGTRKLVYETPLLISRPLFYGAAGCGKGDPRSFACQQIPSSSS